MSFCPKCGEESTPGAAFCITCGASLQLLLNNPVEIPIISSNISMSTFQEPKPEKDSETHMQGKGPVAGVGGWLGLMIVGLLFGWLPDMGNLYINSQKFPQLESSLPWQHYKTTLWVLFFLSVGVKISTAIFLWLRHDSVSVKFAFWGLWFNALGINLVMIATAQVLLNVSIIDDTMVPLLKSSIVALVWSLYLIKSIRIKNTYKYNMSFFKATPA